MEAIRKAKTVEQKACCIVSKKAKAAPGGSGMGEDQAGLADRAPSTLAMKTRLSARRSV